MRSPPSPDPSVAADSIPVADAAAIASTPGQYFILIDGEEMEVTSVNLATNVLTVVRAINGVTATLHANDPVYLYDDQRGFTRAIPSDIGAYQTIRVIPGLMDTTPPTSTVNPLPSQTTSTTFTVSVTASDPNGPNGATPSGVASIAIYDSTNGRAFVLFSTVTPADPSASFTGQAGNTYAFYSIATDEAGNVEPTPAAAQATTTVINTPTPTPIPTPTHIPTQSVIVGEQALFERKTNKKGEPTGKAVLAGFTLDFSVPLNSSAAANGALYEVDTVIRKKLKKRRETILRPITNFVVSYVAASDVVEIKLKARETFTNGGQLTVLGGVTTASGGVLAGNAVFTISKGGKSISPSS